ncbi:MAG: response regulator receiver modulated CheB methylesterase [Frankiales bacterium]|nr:response regulator receiver modulated CheB methylesterase [Frankiales bacterium]
MSRIGVLIVDDSVVIRRLVSDVLAADPDIEVLGTASNGKIALDKLDQLSPDVVTMDIEMPVMDGLQTLRELRKVRPRLPVVMFSTLTERGGTATLEALSLGASDYVTKPANVGSVPQAMESVRTQLIPKIKALCWRPTATATAPVARTAARTTARPASRVDVVAIGSSTGGPEALQKVLPQLPADFPVPVLVVQHMPPLFTRLLADRLNKQCAVEVAEATDGAVLRPGLVLIAPGERHLTVVRRRDEVCVRLTDDPPENFCRPAVDPLFRSVSDVYGGNVLAVVLTGMGQDGRRGAEAVRSRSGHVYAQDAATSVVWGMPGAVTEAGLADRVLPIGDVARDIIAGVGHGRSLSALRATVGVPA